MPLDADDLSEDYDEDAYFIDFEDTARHIIEKDRDQEEEKVEVKELTTNNIVMEEQNFFGLDHLKQPNGEMPAAVQQP